jgi:BlaI family transcriptional regulator, penicillinase repressor
MKGAPKISETEWEIMRIIWARHPLTAADVVEELTRNDASWHPKTARTLLARLVKKGALEYEPLGRVYVYKPRVSKRECQASASRSFLERVFGGSLKPMLAHFAEEKKLTREDLRELSELLEKKGGKK